MPGFILINLSSCKEKKKKTDSILADATCLTLDKQTLGTWIPNLTKPTEPELNRIHYIKFFAAYNTGSKNYDVVAKAYNSADNAIGTALSLKPGTGCDQTLPPLQIGESYDTYLSGFNILNAEGDFINDFEEIILTPGIYPGQSDSLKFLVSVRVGTIVTSLPDVLPCPPCQYCRPVPDTCLATSPMDTSKKASKTDTSGKLP